MLSSRWRPISWYAVWYVLIDVLVSVCRCVCTNFKTSEMNHIIIVLCAPQSIRYICANMCVHRGEIWRIDRTSKNEWNRQTNWWTNQQTNRTKEIHSTNIWCKAFQRMLCCFAEPKDWCDMSYELNLCGEWTRTHHMIFVNKKAMSETKHTYTHGALHNGLHGIQISFRINDTLHSMRQRIRHFTMN